MNFEMTTRHVGIRVVVTDPAGKGASIDLTIAVEDDADEPPAITGIVVNNTPVTPLSYSYSFNEGTAAPLAGQDLNVVEFTATDPDPDNTQDSAITWSLSGEDASDFTIVGGTLTFAKSPNYEAPVDADKNNVYKVTVGFADADGNRGEQEVEVKVGNVDEDGTVTFSAVQPRVGVLLTARLTDIDGGVSNVTWQWYNDDISEFSVIEGATSDTYKPTSDDAADNGVTLQVRATYTDAQGLDKMSDGVAGESPCRRTPGTKLRSSLMTRTLIPAVTAEAKRTIAEKSPARTDLNGRPVTAKDNRH